MTLSTDERLAQLSRWVDEHNAHRDPEAVTWGRLAKVSDEASEVLTAYIGTTGQNPRKGVTHSEEDILEELLDVATTALTAYEHMTGNRGEALLALFEHVAGRHERALGEIR